MSAVSIPGEKASKSDIAKLRKYRRYSIAIAIDTDINKTGKATYNVPDTLIWL